MLYNEIRQTNMSNKLTIIYIYNYWLKQSFSGLKSQDLDNSNLLNVYILINFEFLFLKFLTKYSEFYFIFNDFSYNF